MKPMKREEKSIHKTKYHVPVMQCVHSNISIIIEKRKQLTRQRTTTQPPVHKWRETLHYCCISARSLYDHMLVGRSVGCRSCLFEIGKNEQQTKFRPIGRVWSKCQFVMIGIHFDFNRFCPLYRNRLFVLTFYMLINFKWKPHSFIHVTVLCCRK